MDEDIPQQMEGAAANMEADVPQQIEGAAAEEMSDPMWAWAGSSLGDVDDISQAMNPEQEQRWREQHAKAVDARAHWSHRETAHKHAERIQATIDDFTKIVFLWRGLLQPSSPLFLITLESLSQIVEIAMPGCQAEVPEQLAVYQTQLAKPLAQRRFPIRTVVRKRPVLAFEAEAGEFDCIRTNPRDKRSVLVHDAKLARNGRRIEMTHHHFVFDNVFHEQVTNRAVFDSEVRPLLAAALEGKRATLLCYGQTGTGKTYTLSGMLREVVGAAGQQLSLQCYELMPTLRQEVVDLMSEKRKNVRCCADEHDQVHVRGCVTVEIEDQLHLESTLAAALARRNVRVTERNPISSRSHAFCKLLFPSGGSMCFVDLAGSERNYETTKMTAAMHRESAHINKALMALKDCFRMFHKQLAVEQQGGQKAIRVPFRESKLTQMLRECFTDVEHMTTVMTCVSPTPTDLQHSVNSLAHSLYCVPPLVELHSTIVCDVPIFLHSDEVASTPVQQWTCETVKQWVATVEDGRFAQLALPPHIDGPKLLLLNASKIGELFSCDTLKTAGHEDETDAWVVGADELTHNSVDIGAALYKALRDEQLVYRQQAARKNGRVKTALLEVSNQYLH